MNCICTTSATPAADVLKRNVPYLTFQLDSMRFARNSFYSRFHTDSQPLTDVLIHCFSSRPKDWPIFRLQAAGLNVATSLPKNGTKTKPRSNSFMQFSQGLAHGSDLTNFITKCRFINLSSVIEKRPSPFLFCLLPFIFSVLQVAFNPNCARTPCSSKAPNRRLRTVQKEPDI